MSSSRNVSATRRRAAAAIRRISSGCASAQWTCSARSCGSPGANSRPCSMSCTSSRMTPEFTVRTGTSAAMASARANPNPSNRLGNRKRSAAASRRSTSSRGPSIRTCSPRPMSWMRDASRGLLLARTGPHQNDPGIPRQEVGHRVQEQVVALLQRQSCDREQHRPPGWMPSSRRISARSGAGRRVAGQELDAVVDPEDPAQRGGRGAVRAPGGCRPRQRSRSGADRSARRAAAGEASPQGPEERGGTRRRSGDAAPRSRASRRATARVSAG